MPNPTDSARTGNEIQRGTNLINSAASTATTKMSWSEWFGATSNTWLGGAGVGYVTDLVVGGGRTGLFLAGSALAVAIVPPLGIFSVVVASSVGGVAVDVVGKKLEDMAKEKLPDAIETGRTKIGSMWFGGGANPTVVLNRDVGTATLEGTLKKIKENCALIQDLLNKLAGKAGKAYWCDDVYQIAVLAGKLNTTKAELTTDISVLKQFLAQLESDLNQVDSTDIDQKVKKLAEEVCKVNDGRHWDNSWSVSSVLRVSKCSKEHCFGPR